MTWSNQNYLVGYLPKISLWMNKHLLVLQPTYVQADWITTMKQPRLRSKKRSQVITRNWCWRVLLWSWIPGRIASTGWRNGQSRKGRRHVGTTRWHNAASWIWLRYTSRVCSARVASAWSSGPCNNCCIVSSYRDMALQKHKHSLRDIVCTAEMMAAWNPAGSWARQTRMHTTEHMNLCRGKDCHCLVQGCTTCLKGRATYKCGTKVLGHNRV